ncbi:MAG: NrtA/SsuA/CpmA family ABC transporter substrate-binding protein [Nanoarchaeota archaeon]
MKRKNISVIISIFIIILLVGCDSQYEPQQSEEQSQPMVYVADGEQAQAQPNVNIGGSLNKINIAYPSAGTMISGQIGLIMQRTDIPEKNGLDAEIFPMGTGKEMKSALLAGQVDVILTSESNFVVLLGAGFKSYGIASLGTDGEMGLVVKEDSDIYDISDLKGKKIATLFGTSVHKPAIEWAKQAGLTPGVDVEVVNIGNAGGLRTALLLGEVDAIVDWDPFLTDGLNNGRYRILKKADLDLIVVMSADYADKNPEAVSKFRETLKETAFYMSQNKKSVTQWYSELSKLEPEFIDQVSKVNNNYNAITMDDIDISIPAEFTVKLIKIANFMYDEGLIKNNPDITGHIRQ